MKGKKFRLRILLPLALICVLTAVAVSGDNITSSDPLVSLSYLNSTFQTKILEEMQSSVNKEIAKLEERLQKRADGISAAISSQSAAVPTHSTATIPAGSSYSVPGGSEFLFLSGAVNAAGNGLTDLTDGVAVSAQGTLTVHHLYSASAPVTLKAGTASKIMIRK